MGEQLEELRSIYDDYRKDIKFEHLRKPNIRFVPGAGLLNPKVMIIGEAPGPMENSKVQPFIGRSGALLEQYLSDEGFNTFDEVFTTNVVKYWPRADRNKSRHPTKDEMETSKPFLLDEIETVNPLVIGLLGISVISLILPELTSVGPNLGKLYDEQGNLTQIEGRFVPLYHPALILHSPEKKHSVKNGFYNLRLHVDKKLAKAA